MDAKKLLIATKNPGKVAEFRKLLVDLPLEVIGPDELGYEVPECKEEGSSFCENAIVKARHWFNKTGLAVMADDSGLVVEALDGAPGIHSARFAGAKAEDRNKIEKLLILLEGVEQERRKAAFICCLALCRPCGNVVTFQGKCNGFILEEPRGTKGFGYDPVFYYPAFGKTFAQMEQAQKNSVSHRGLAIQQFYNWLIQNEI